MNSATRDEDIKTLTEMAEGLEAAAFAEQIVMDGLKPWVDRFEANDKDKEVYRYLRIYNDATANRRRYAKEAMALRSALAIIVPAEGG